MSASIRSRLMSGGFWALSGKIASAISNLLISGLLARLLSPEDVGVYFLIFSVTMAGSVLAQLGLNQLAVRFIAEAIAKKKTNQIRSIIARIFLITSISTIGIVFLLNAGLGTWIAQTVFKSTTMAKVVGISSLWIITLCFQSLLAECFRGLHDIRLATLFQTLAANLILLIPLTSIWLTDWQLSIFSIIAFTVMAGLISITVAALLLYTQIRKHPETAETDYSNKYILQTAWPLLITNITLFILSQTSIWILGIFRDSEEVALYGAAVRLINLVAMPLMIANAVLPPMITELYTHEKFQKLQQVLRSTATLTGLPALAVILCFMLLGEFTLSTVYGDYYTKATSILFILSLGQMINILAGSCGLTLMMTGHQTTMMFITLFSGCLGIVLSIVVVTPYGTTGIALVTAGVLIIQNMMMLVFTKHKVGVWTHASLSLTPILKTLKG